MRWGVGAEGLGVVGEIGGLELECSLDSDSDWDLDFEVGLGLVSQGQWCYLSYLLGLSEIAPPEMVAWGTRGFWLVLGRIQSYRLEI